LQNAAQLCVVALKLVQHIGLLRRLWKNPSLRPPNLPPFLKPSPLRGKPIDSTLGGFLKGYGVDLSSTTEMLSELTERHNRVLS